MTLIKRNLPILLILPYFIAVTAMLVLDSGDKKIIPFIILSIMISILLYKKELIIKNLQSPFIWLLSIVCAYTIFSYYYHGSSSREMRALLGSTLFLLFFPYQILTKRAIQWIVLVGSFTVCINSIYFNLYMGIERGAGYINPIPYATACALISMIAFSLLLNNSPLKEKVIPLIAFSLSLFPIILSETRGIWLAFSITLLVLIIVKILISPPSRNQIFVAIITTAILLPIATQLFKGHVEQRYDKTIYEIKEITNNNYNTSIGRRIKLWQLAPKIFKDKPLLGHGHESQSILKEKLKNKEISQTIFNLASTHYHNQFLDRMVRYGIFGLVLLLGIIIYPLTKLKNLDEHEKYIAISSVSLFFIASLTDVPFNHPQPLILYLLFLVPICSRCKRVTND
ncbi:O-antigen ligase family protein [Vibrio splendidus]|uniref:O-antigen ligase family protein n=1 Tax=Vibrio splendidus TaxID=29497 RepID=UPI003D0CD684